MMPPRCTCDILLLKSDTPCPVHGCMGEDSITGHEAANLNMKLTLTEAAAAELGAENTRLRELLGEALEYVDPINGRLSAFSRGLKQSKLIAKIKAELGE